MGILPAANSTGTGVQAGGGVSAAAAAGDGSLFAALLAITGAKPAVTADVGAEAGTDVATLIESLKSRIEDLPPGIASLLGDIEAGLSAEGDASAVAGDDAQDPLAALFAAFGIGAGDQAGSQTNSPFPAGAGTGHPPESPLPRPVPVAATGPHAAATDPAPEADASADTGNPKASAAANAGAKADAAALDAGSAGDAVDEVLAQLVRQQAPRHREGDAKPAPAANAAAKAPEATGDPSKTVAAAETDLALQRIADGRADAADKPDSRSKADTVAVIRPAQAPGQSMMLELQRADGTPVVTVETGVRAAAAQTPVQPASASSTAFPVQPVAVEIARQARAGNHRFQIRLDPPELGRIDVRLDLHRDGQVQTRLTVDNADTFDAIQRDPRGLERALQNAGLKLDDGSVQVSLRDSGQFAQRDQTGRDPQNFARTPYASAVDVADGEEMIVEAWQIRAAGHGRLDLSV